MKRVEYAGSVHDEEEIEAVVSVLRGGPTALRIGKFVREMERLVAESFGKRRGVMVNSGSSALYLAVELLGLAPGDEIITSAVTFSTDIAPMVRAGLVPVFVDVEPDTYQIDVAQIESAIGPRTKAILAPNLIGNCPDWDVIREIADRHGLQVVEDSCDCLGATLRGTPTGTRSDISLTSFALSHIITAAGTGGMLCVDDDERLDKALLLRRWGRRSEPKLFGSKKGDKRFFSEIDGIEYDDLFIFDEVGWNFEPSEISAAFGVVQLRKLPLNLAATRIDFMPFSGHKLYAPKGVGALYVRRGTRLAPFMRGAGHESGDQLDEEWVGVGGPGFPRVALVPDSCDVGRCRRVFPTVPVVGRRSSGIAHGAPPRVWGCV